MQVRRLTKNRFTVDSTRIRSFQDDDTEEIIFISYRRTHCDTLMARACAERLETIPGLHYWLDEQDGCMQQAHARGDDVQKALCIEDGLDVSSALLGIIGPETFDSPWIPYEIGGARGRQRYKEMDSQQTPHPLIAHLIHEIPLREVPAFVALGTPLVYRKDLDDPLYEVETWAKSVAEILQESPVSSYKVDSIQHRQGLKAIYQRNVRGLKPTSRF